MQPGFDQPVGSFQTQEEIGIGALARQASHPVVDHLIDADRLAFTQVGEAAFQAKDLPNLRPVQILVEQVGGCQRAFFNPAVAFIHPARGLEIRCAENWVRMGEQILNRMVSVGFVFLDRPEVIPVSLHNLLG